MKFRCLFLIFNNTNVFRAKIVFHGVSALITIKIKENCISTMAEEEHYEDVDISDIVDDSEHYLVDSEPLHTETTDSDSLNTIQNSEILHSEEQATEDKKVHVQKPEVIRSTRLPMARIKNIMKMDPDVSVISGDAVFLVTKATELFLETIAKETFEYTASNKRKTIAKKDFDVVVNKVDCLCFLEGAMDF